MYLSAVRSMVVLAIFGLSCSQMAAKSFHLVLLPDTQIYAEKYPEIFKAQTRWAADNASTISFVLQQGDLTNRNSREQWRVAREAMNLMDGKVPYCFVAGNHDIGTSGSAKTRTTRLMNRFFPFEKYEQLPHFGDAFTKGEIDNTWYRFKQGDQEWIILCLEFGPRNKVLDWANKVVAEHPEAKVIINTHAYMYSDDTRIGKEDKWNPHDYGVGKDEGENAVNDGEEIWEKLVRKHANILLVVSGHILNDGAGRLVSEGDKGNKVYQMLANYQGGVKGSQNGGNGFLRILQIDPDKGTIKVKTWSPYTQEYKTDGEQEFEFTDVKF